jgi:hypothetical protein
MNGQNLVTFDFFEFKTYHNLSPNEWWTGWGMSFVKEMWKARPRAMNAIGG